MTILLKKSIHKLYESDLACYFLIRDNVTLFPEWKSGQYYSDKIFKESVIALTEFLKTHPVTKILDDSLQVDYPIPPDMQLWVAQTITPVFLEMGLQKYALVQPTELLGELSNQQIFDEIDEVSDGSFVSKVFSSQQKALAWLRA